MSNWPNVALADIFDISRGGSPRPIDSYITDDPDGVNWIMIGDASEGSKYITGTKKRIRADGAARSRRVRPGDFLLTNSMSFGKPYIVATTGCVHDGWLVLSPREPNVDSDFFYHLLRSNVLYAEFERRASGATVKNLNIDLVRGVRVPLPPPNEQQRIAGILDHADALRAKRRAAIAQLDSLAAAIFLDMFGDPGVNAKQWREAPIEACSATIQIGPFGSLLHEEDYVEGGIPLVNPKHIQAGRIVPDTAESVTPDKYSRLSNYVLRSGDVVMGRRGEMGRCAVVQPEHDGLVCGTGSLFIRPDSAKVTPLYLSTLLSTGSLRQRLQRISIGLTLPNLNRSKVANLTIPVPPLGEQIDFGRRLTSVRRIKSRYEDALTVTDALIRSLQHRAFRGEL